MAALCLLPAVLTAQVKLPPVFADGMVLQQQSDVAIWGKTTPGRKVTVRTGWNGKHYKTVAAADSTWRVKVATPEASYTTYRVTIDDGEKLTLENVAIGEVWLCGGQSNMEMPVGGYPNQPVIGSHDDIVNSANDFLRCFTVARNGSLTPVWDAPGKWEIAAPGTTPGFTATGYYFGRLLQRLLDVPVGLLHCSYGGSSIETWMSAEGLAEVKPEQKIPEKLTPEAKLHATPTALFNGMLWSVMGYGMRGAIWYQGESNRTRYSQYPRLFENMHNDWEARWQIGEFPIYFVQLAPYGKSVDRDGPFMREAQEKIAKTQPRTGMAVLMDVGEELGIHPANKRITGERLAYVALAKSYGFDVEYEAPQFVSWEVEGNKILLKFAPAARMTTFGRTLDGQFEIAGADRKFYPADAVLLRTGVEVSSPAVPQPVAVRYAFKNYIQGALFGINGLPLSSFRTDDWNDVKPVD